MSPQFSIYHWRNYLTSAVIGIMIASFLLPLSLMASTASYGSYVLATMIFSSEMPTTSESLRRAMIDRIWMWIIAGGTTICFSLFFATAAAGYLYHLGRLYLASPPGQFILRLPGVRLLPHLHRKYWLPSGVPLQARPRFFYLKRFIIRQSAFTIISPQFLVTKSCFM